jgi:hypothetical protein
VSTATQGGGPLTSGDLVAFLDQWWAVWTGSADCTADWEFRQLSFAGDVDLSPDAFRSGVGNNHVVFTRDGPHVVYRNNASGTYRGRDFRTPGGGPRVTTSQGPGVTAPVAAAGAATAGRRSRRRPRPGRRGERGGGR